MSFSQIVWKMAKVHYKKYLFYFLCNSFAVMFFFMFSTVFFNEQIVQVRKLTGIEDALKIPVVALVVFTILFISYAHSIFMKKRRSEFGLFMTLGMSNRDISKLLLLENGVIALLSILTGLLAGTIFSRLFFLLLMEIVGLQGVPFQINSNMFLYSIGAYFLVFSIAVGRSLFLTLKRDLIDSLKSDKVAETIEMKSPLIGGFGLAILIGSVLGLYLTYGNSHDGGAFLIFWASSTFLGLYISLSQFASFFIELAKKNKQYYFPRLLLLTSLDYKFKKLTSILMLVTVLIMVTILYSTINLFTYISNEKRVVSENPFDIAFIQTEDKNNLPKKELYSIIDQKEHPVQKQLEVSIFYYYKKSEWFADSLDVFPLMPVEDFNKLATDKVNLQDKEYLYYINQEQEYAEGFDQNLPFPISEEEKSFTLKDTIVGQNINWLSNLGDYIVVSNSEFERLKKGNDGLEANIQLFKVDNWKNTANTVEKLEIRLKSYNEKAPTFDGPVEEVFSEEIFRVFSKVGANNLIKQSDGLLFFVMSFISVIFVFGSIMLLYLNLFADIEKEKDKFDLLNKIGFTAKEAQRIISREITTVFFVPTTVGITLAFLYIIAMANDIGGITENLEILLHFAIIAGIYLCIQTGLFLYARKKMFFYLTE